MANAWLNLYSGNPTAGGTDGTAVSTGDNSNPLTFILDASLNENQEKEVALRCEPGFCTATDTTITAYNDVDNRWAFSLDDNTWSDTLIIGSTIDSLNTNFFIKASASDNEVPHNDTDVKIRTRTKIAAVS